MSHTSHQHNKEPFRSRLHRNKPNIRITSRKKIFCLFCLQYTMVMVHLTQARHPTSIYICTRVQQTIILEEKWIGTTNCQLVKIIINSPFSRLLVLGQLYSVKKRERGNILLTNGTYLDYREGHAKRVLMHPNIPIRMNKVGVGYISFQLDAIKQCNNVFNLLSLAFLCNTLLRRLRE